MSKKVYDFGVVSKGIAPDERKIIAWPVAAWSCYVPENLNTKINILEKLILSLARLNITDFNPILCKELGVSPELVRTIMEDCKRKGYLHSVTKNLTKTGEQIIKAEENPYSFDMELSKTSKKVYLLKDLVSGAVIPYFDLANLPTDYRMEDQVIELPYDKKELGKVSTASISLALKQWNKIRKNSKLGDSYDQGAINLVQPIEDDEFDSMEEVPWTLIDENGEISNEEPNEEKVETLAHAEEQAVKKQIANITIYDDKPEILYAKGYIAINKNDPEELFIKSPFGEDLNGWFRTVVNRHRGSNSKFEEELQWFLEERKAVLAGRYAFNNDLNVPIFEKFPLLCNDSKYRDLKKSIEDVAKDVERINRGEDETSNFAKNIRVLLDSIFREVIKASDAIYNLKWKCKKYSDYENIFRDLELTYDLDHGMINKYCKETIFNNMKQNSKKRGGAKDYSAMLFLDAYFNNNSKSVVLLREYPEIFMNVHELSNEGNNMAHGNEGYGSITYGVEKVNENYNTIETMISVLYQNYMEEEK